MPLLELRQIEKSFPGARVLRGVDFDVEAGEVHALVGANGAGKSTLIKILAGAYVRDAGEIRIDGAPVHIANPLQAIRLGIGVIYQEFNLVPELTVAENMLLGQEPVRSALGVPLLSRRALLREAADHLRSLDFALDPTRPVRELTTGEKQLVEIAKALHRRARVLVLDEPTAALSRRETERLFRIMRGLQERGIGMIYISHHLEEVFEVANRISALRDGARVATWRRGEVTETALVEAMLGRAVETGSQPTLAAADGEVMLEADRLNGPGFRNVSFSVRRGEVFAITGAAGAGQTELCWSIAGAAPVREGTLRLAGRQVRWRSPRDATRSGVLLAPGDRKAYGILPGQSVRANLTLSTLGRYAPAGVLQRGRLNHAAGDLIRRYDVRCSGPDQEIQLLSGGNQQKVVVGRAAEGLGTVYLFDEPTRGVDVGAREEIYALIRGLSARGAAVIVATPDILEALRLGDRIGVMRQGHLVYDEPAERAGEAAILAAILGAEGQEGREREARSGIGS